MTTRNPIAAAALLLITLLAAPALAAAPPDALNYQGVLRNSANKPLTGVYDMVFRFFNDTVAVSLPPLYGEEHWRLIEESLRLIGRTNSRVLHIPLLAQTGKWNAADWRPLAASCRFAAFRSGDGDGAVRGRAEEPVCCGRRQAGPQRFQTPRLWGPMPATGQGASLLLQTVHARCRSDARRGRDKRARNRDRA
jgi:hypothetical protein